MEYSEDDYKKAKKQVDELKGFYIHLSIYVGVNLFLILGQTGIYDGDMTNLRMPGIEAFFTPFFWGIGLLGHFFHVFQHKFTFFKSWEERKIKQFMEEDEMEFEDLNRWDS